jgi:hypothetical protein
MEFSSANSTYSRALAELKNELVILDCEIDRLGKRKAQIEAAIANIMPLLPQANVTLDFQESLSESAEQSTDPIWKSVLVAINGKGEGFSVKDALEAVERIGRPVESPNRFQIMRNALIRKSDIFDHLGSGLFAVRTKEKEAPEGTS